MTSPIPDPNGNAYSSGSGSVWIAPAAILTALATSVVLYPRLPARIPIHWGINGQVNGWASRPVGASFGAALAIVLWLVLQFLPRIDSRTSMSPAFRGSYQILVNGVVIVLVLVHLLVLAHAVGWPVPMTAAIQIVVGLLNILIGSVLPGIPPNGFVGVRTQWTRSSPEAWARTNRIAGRALVAGGAVMLLSAALPSPVGLVIGVAALLLASMTPLLLSFVWRSRGD